MKKSILLLLLSFLLKPGIGKTQLPAVIDLGNFGEDVRISAEEEILLGSDLATGDFNGDNFDDILIGAAGAKSDDGFDVGRIYLVFGGPKLSSIIDISNPMTNTVNIYGDNPRDYTGRSVASGDINGDGFMDAIIGAPQLITHPANGLVYIVYGRENWPDEISFNTNGQPIDHVSRISGKQPQNFAGSVVASGDVNGDGYWDVIIGAFGAGPSRDFGREGEFYILYGSGSLPEIVELNSDSISMTTIQGNTEGRIGEFGGCYDVNSDGFWDVLIGNPGYTRSGSFAAGKVYVVYGTALMPKLIDLDTDTATGNIHGVTQIIGEHQMDHIGPRLSGGDVNGDGFGDLIVGTYQTTNSGEYTSGKLYVVFGTSILPSVIDLREYDYKLTIFGASKGELLGLQVAAGDFNDDGFADIITSAPFSKVDKHTAGKVYLIYGSPNMPEISEINLIENLSQTMQIWGYQSYQNLGNALSAGDINGDGVEDIVTSAYTTRTAAGFDAGEVYVIYGREKDSQPVVSETQLLLNYPNPFNSYTVIPYQLKEGQIISIKIYNSTGQELRQLVGGWMEAGEHRAIWNGYDDRFQQVSSGVYFCKLTGETFSETRKILLLK